MEVENELKARSSVNGGKSNQIEARRAGWARSWWKMALGLLGALLAIPLAAALKVFIIQVLAPAVQRQVGAEETTQGEA